MLSNRLKVQLSLSGKHSDTTGMLYLLQTVSEARVIWVDKSCCMIRHVFFFFFFFQIEQCLGLCFPQTHPRDTVQIQTRRRKYVCVVAI